MWPVCHSHCQSQMTENSAEVCSQLWGGGVASSTLSARSCWQQQLLTLSLCAACGSYSKAPSQFKFNCRSPWDEGLLHSFTIPVVNPVEPPRTVVWCAWEGRESQVIICCIAGRWCYRPPFLIVGFCLFWGCFFSVCVFFVAVGLGFLGWFWFFIAGEGRMHVCSCFFFLPSKLVPGLTVLQKSCHWQNLLSESKLSLATDKLLGGIIQKMGDFQKKSVSLGAGSLSKEWPGSAGAPPLIVGSPKTIQWWVTTGTYCIYNWYRFSLPTWEVDIKSCSYRRKMGTPSRAICFKIGGISS